MAYLIVEKDSVEKLTKLLDPVLTIGSAKIRPVKDALITLERRVK